MSTRYVIDPLDVMALASQGKTAQETADTLGVALNTVHQHARDMGVRFARRPHSTRTPDDVRARTRQLADEGLSQSQIAAQVGKSRSWVAMYLRGER